MEENKKVAPAVTEATGELQARIEDVTIGYITWLGKNLEQPGLSNNDAVFSINGCIRTLYHLKKVTAIKPLDNEVLQAKLETLTRQYLDFLEKNMVEPGSISRDVVFALNDCVRVMHVLKKLHD